MIRLAAACTAVPPRGSAALRLRAVAAVREVARVVLPTAAVHAPCALRRRAVPHAAVRGVVRREARGVGGVCAAAERRILAVDCVCAWAVVLRGAEREGGEEEYEGKR
jgi:hypothetical protein